MTRKHWIIVGLFVLDTLAGFTLYAVERSRPAAEPEPMVQETVIGLAPKATGPDQARMVEIWRLDGRHTMRHCAQMSALANVGQYGALIVRCKP